MSNNFRICNIKCWFGILSVLLQKADVIKQMKMPLTNAANLTTITSLQLMVSIRPHLGHVAALQEAYNTNGCRKMISVPYLLYPAPNGVAVLFVSVAGILGVRRFGDRTNPRVAPGQV